MKYFIKGILVTCFLFIVTITIAIGMDFIGTKKIKKEIPIVQQKEVENIDKFYIDSGDYIYETEEANHEAEVDMYKTILERAKAMVEVKWTPRQNIKGYKNSYVFKVGQTYIGIPYSQGSVQISSANEFLEKISNTKSLLGNDCSGFVSFAWGIARQTTLSFYNAIKKGEKVDGKILIKVPWEEIKGGDALIKEDGSGKGHIILFNKRAEDNGDNIFVYEQNVAVKGKSSIPVAREDTQSIKELIKEGYFPIRIVV